MTDVATRLLDPEPLAGKAALVTGAASGIGRQVAMALSAAGAAVFMVDRDEAGLTETRAIVTDAGGSAACHVADLSVEDEVVGCPNAAMEAFGRIDILVNCAGIALSGDQLLESDESVWDTVYAVNVKAPYLLMKRVGRIMADRGEGGRIVNITSSSAHRERMSMPAYGSSKSALMQLTRLAAADLAPYDINCNAIAPGVTVTPMVRGTFDDEQIQAQVSDGPLANLFQRASQPIDIADTVLFLCLPASRQITGQTIQVSAGAII